jgi:hypothetical protein
MSLEDVILTFGLPRSIRKGDQKKETDSSGTQCKIQSRYEIADRLH